MTAPFFTPGGSCRALTGLGPEFPESDEYGDRAGVRRSRADRSAPALPRSSVAARAAITTLCVCLMLGVIVW